MRNVQPLDSKTRRHGMDAAKAVGARFFSEQIGKVELHRLTASYGFDRIELRELDRGHDAVSVKRADGGYTLFLNSTHPRVRLRFSVAHELSHWILTPILGKRVLHVRRFSKNQDPFGDQIEYLCNDMASVILMPTVQARRMLDNSKQSARCVPDLARSFDTSFEAAARRFVQLSQEPCALIVWNKTLDGSIRYPRRTIWNKRLGNCLIQFDGQSLSPALGRSVGRPSALIASEEKVMIMRGGLSRGTREVLHNVPVESFVRRGGESSVYWSFVRFAHRRIKPNPASISVSSTCSEAQLRPQAVHTQLEFANLA